MFVNECRKYKIFVKIIRFSLITLSFCFAFAITLIFLMILIAPKTETSNSTVARDVSSHRNDILILDPKMVSAVPPMDGEGVSKKSHPRDFLKLNKHMPGVKAINDKVSPTHRKFVIDCGLMCSSDPSSGGKRCLCDDPPFAMKLLRSLH